MVERLEKKMVVAMVLVGATVVLAGFVVWYSKNRTENTTPVATDIVKAEVVNPNATPASAPDASSQIAVGSESVAPKEETKTKSGGVAKIKWEDLYKLDYKTGKAPDSVKKLDKKRVRIPGFIVPLSDDLSALKEFLLVPNAQACIHVPPPPPNLIVYVVLDRAIPIDKVSNPSWVEGVLKIETTKSEYGNAAYKMNAEVLEEYKF